MLIYEPITISPNEPYGVCPLPRSRGRQQSVWFTSVGEDTRRTCLRLLALDHPHSRSASPANWAELAGKAEPLCPCLCGCALCSSRTRTIARDFHLQPFRILHSLSRLVSCWFRESNIYIPGAGKWWSAINLRYHIIFFLISIPSVYL